jgi:hypothetical protein
MAHFGNVIFIPHPQCPECRAFGRHASSRMPQCLIKSLVFAWLTVHTINVPIILPRPDNGTRTIARPAEL